MWVIGLCVVMVVAGLLAVVRWGGMAVQPPPTPAGSAPGPDGRLPVGLDGTLGFIIFTGLLFGAASGAAYLLLRRWLPAGRAGAAAFAAHLPLLLLALGSVALVALPSFTVAVAGILGRP